MCSSNAPCTCTCCSSEARSARRRAARLVAAGVSGPRDYLRADVHERIRQLRAGEVDIETGLSDPDPAVQFEAELLTSTGPDYSKMDRERLEQLAREADNPDALADIYAEAQRRGDNWVMLYIAMNKNANADTLRACAESGLPATRAAGLNGLHRLGLASTEELAETGTVNERMAVAKRCAPEVAEAMAGDKSPRVRRVVAGALIGAAVAMLLARDSDRGVRKTLAATTEHEDVLLELTEDSDDKIAATARERLAQVRGGRISTMDAHDVVTYVRGFDGPAEVVLPGGRYMVVNAERYGDETVLFTDNDAVSRDSARAGLQACFDASPEGKQVTVPSDVELAAYKSVMTTTDGLAGVGVKHDGEIAALYSNSTKRGVTGPLFDAARDEGGTWLECFDTYLPKVYAKNGMVPVARIPFVREYAPSGWDYDIMGRYNNGEPDLVFMVTDTVATSRRYNDEPLGVLFADWDDAYSYTMNGGE